MIEIGGQRLASALYHTDQEHQLVFCEDICPETGPSEGLIGSGGKKVDAGNKKLQGTFIGVYLPVCSSMFGVLIFIRFSSIVGYTGWIMAWGFTILSAFVQLVNTISLCAVLSNSRNYSGGTFGILKRNLGVEVAGVVCLTYYLGMTVMSSVELLGSVQAIDYILYNSPTFQGGTVTGSMYWDQVAIGGPLLLVLAVIRTIDVKYVHGMTTFIFVVVVISFIFGYIGIFLTLGTWRGTMGDVPEVTGLNVTTFMNNAFPDWTPANSSEAFLEPLGVIPEAVLENQIRNPAAALSIIFPMFLGIFQGANKAADLVKPNRNVIKGTGLAISTSLIVYSLFFLLLAGVAERSILKVEFLLFNDLTWPTAYIGIVGTILVGIGACVELLEIGPTILFAVSSDGLFSVLQRLRLDKKLKNGEPINCIMVSFGINFLILFVGSEYFEMLTTIVTMFFLQAYASMHFALLLNEAQSHPSWRPVFRYYHWSLALLGATGCVTMMFYIQWIMALVTWLAQAVLLILVRVLEEPRRKGLGFHAFNIGRALKYLLTDDLITNRELLKQRQQSNTKQQLPPEERFWTPSVLCVIEAPTNLAKEREHLKLLHLTNQLCNRGLYPQLAVVSSMVNARTCVKNHLPIHQEQERQRLRLFSLTMMVNLNAFVQAVVSPRTSSTADSYLISMQSIGIGGLKPNMVLLWWKNKDLLHLVQNAKFTSTHVCVLKDRKRLQFKHEGKGKEKEKEKGMNHATSSSASTSSSTVMDGDERDDDVVVENNGIKSPSRNDSESSLPSLPEDADVIKVETMQTDEFLENLDSLHFNKWRRRTKTRLKARKGMIDIWWVVKNGGLPVILGKYLSTHRVWAKCSIRVFATVESETFSDLVTARAIVQVEKMLKLLRVTKAEVDVIQINPRTGTVLRKTQIDEEQHIVFDDKVDSEKPFSSLPVGLGIKQFLETVREDEESEVPEEHEEELNSMLNPLERVKSHHRSTRSSLMALFGDQLETEESREEGHKKQEDLMEEALRTYHGLLLEFSKNAQLVVMNLPRPKQRATVESYQNRLTRLTEGIDRVLFVHVCATDDEFVQGKF